MNSNVLIISNQITVFAGYMPDVGLHSHYTAVLVFSLEGEPIAVAGEGGEWSGYARYFLHPDVLNKMRNHDQLIGCVFFEPESSLYSQFIKGKDLGREGLVEYVEPLEDLVALMKGYFQAPNNTDAFIQSVVSCLMGAMDCSNVSEGDLRVDEVSKEIKRDLAANASAMELANLVNISERQLSTLFKRQLGVPIRRYRQWLRLKEVARLVGEGQNLTDAALNAGFSDSAHFSNTCRKMLGVKPTDLLLSNMPLMLYASSDCV